MSMDSLLPFEKQLLLDTFEDDWLIINARGLGIDRLFLNYLKLYSDPKLLVLVINTSPDTEDFCISELKKMGVPVIPVQITSDISQTERLRMYDRGGILFVTSRILVMDLLTDKLPTQLVAGILVYNAHRLLNSFQESFILRLYRQKKSDGFVKAFTDHPTALAFEGLGQLQRLVSNLYVRKVNLLPRFHADVKQSLQQNAPEVIEMRFKLTPGMRKIRAALSEIIIACLKELAQANPSQMKSKNDDSDGKSKGEKPGISTKMCAPTLDESSSKVVHETQMERRLLAETRNSLSGKTEQLLSDLKFLRSLLAKLETSDSVSFFKSVAMLKEDKQKFSTNVGWLFTSSAKKLFAEAEKRLNIESDSKTSADDERSISIVQEDLDYDDFGIELPPKFRALYAVLKEINDTISEAQDNTHPTFGNTLILTATEYSAQQIYNLISNGPAKNCANIALRAESLKSHTNRKIVVEVETKPLWDTTKLRLWSSKLPTSRGAKIATTGSSNNGAKGRSKRTPELEPGQTTLSDLVNPKKLRLDHHIDHENTAQSKRECVIFPLSDNYSLLKFVHSFKPTFVVFYQSNLAALRTIEMYSSIECESPVRLYFLMYEDYSEEQSYLTALHTEKTAFQFLIQESGSLLNRREYDVSRATVNSEDSSSSRKAGGNNEDVQKKPNPQTIVDMRELRSELPLVLYKRGIDVIPVTLEVGDYVLSPNIVVERKSHTDLVQSLQSGRLYTQVINMNMHYTTVILLIEGGTGSGRKYGGGPFGGDLGPVSRDLRAKLSVLTRQCPSLRLVWTQDPQATAQLFDELKFNQPEPNAETATKIKVDEVSVDMNDDVTRPTCRDLVMSLPGVSNKQAQSILGNNVSFQDICKMDPNTIAQLLGSDKSASQGKIAKDIFAFVNKQYTPDVTNKFTSVKLL